MQDFPSFWQAAQQVPEKIAVREVDGRSQTFGELLQKSNQIAQGLQALGLDKGDNVAVLLPNCLEVFEVFFATSQVGLYFTSVNHVLTATEIAYILDNSEAKRLFVHDAYRDKLSEALAYSKFPPEHCIWVTDSHDHLGNEQGDDSGENELSYTVFQSEQSAALPAKRSAGQTMLYSSGTTGKPKGVRHPLPSTSPGDFYACRGNALSIFGVKPYSGVHLVNGPLYHAGPLQFAAVSLHFGHTVVVTGKWDAQRCLQLLGEYSITTTMMVPTMFVRLLALPIEERQNWNFPDLAVVISSAASCAVPVKREIIDWFGPVIFDFYGGTEGPGAACSSAQWLEKPGTSGPPVPTVSMKIINDDGDELPTGEIGTVYMTPVQGAALPQYFKDSDKSASVIKGDYFTIGDMGYLDDDGWLFLVDRRSDLIISGGVNIYPSEVEQVLIQHASVRDVAVVGKPDDEWGHSVCAFIVAEGASENSNDLRQQIHDFAAVKLAKYKLPKQIEFVTELPRADNGKLYRRRLLES